MSEGLQTLFEGNGRIVDIGQVTRDQRLELSRLIYAGKVVKTRGYWAFEGMGPLKSIFTLTEVAQ